MVKLELVAATSHTKDFETVYFRDKTRRWHHVVIEMLKKKMETRLVKRHNEDQAYLEENMRETGTEVRSVDVELLLAWKVHVSTARTVDFHA